jgi:hypothetical protein
MLRIVRKQKNSIDIIWDERKELQFTRPSLSHIVSHFTYSSAYGIEQVPENKLLGEII